jgi:uncharacterized protein YjdB
MGVGLQFYVSPPHQIYQGDGYSKIFLKGSLKEKIGLSDLAIPFIPYNAGGPVMSSTGSAEKLAAAEVIRMIGGIPYDFVSYDVAVSFPYGKGKVFYSSFPIPLDLVGELPPGASAMSMSTQTVTPLQAFARWFMAKPIANAELVRITNAYNIDQTDSLTREDSTVGEGKTIGLPIDLKTANEDATVIALVNGVTLGNVDYSTISPDYYKHRRWTATLYDSADQHYETRTTSGDIMVFQVKSSDNDAGTWRIRIDNTTGYLDENLFATMIVTEKREDIIDGGRPIDPGFIPMSGITLSPKSSTLMAGSTLQLSTSIFPSNATSQDVIWATTSADIVSVDGNGFLTALSAGKARVSVATVEGGYTADSIITVKTIVPVTGVTLTSTSADVAINSTLRLTATIIPSNATSKDVSWSSSNSSVASVDTTGLVTGVAAGAATITVTTEDGNISANSYITVLSQSIPVSSIDVTPSSLVLQENGQSSVSVIFTPSNATNKTISWSTSNSSVAMASNGVISAHAAGIATITATTQDGNKTAYCYVTVKSSKQMYYENKYPNKTVIILPSGGDLGEAHGDTVIVGGDGDDFIEFYGGGNVFVYEAGGGHDVITSVNVESGDMNELHFGPGIVSADLIFFREGDNLYISIAGENGSVTIMDWYLGDEYKLKIVFDDGAELTPVEIEELAVVLTIINGTIETNLGSYNDGEIIPVYDFFGGSPILQFVPIPSDAPIESVAWESNVILNAQYVNDLIVYDAVPTYTWGEEDGYISVTVNGNFTMQVSVDLKFK